MANKEKIIWFLVIGVIVISGYYLFFVKNQTKKEGEATKQEEISKGDLIIKELADKYQARTNWEENLTYTLQAQERLITGKPVLFRGYIDDIFNRNGKTFIRLSSSFFSSADYVFELECSEQILDEILSKPQDGENYFKLFDEYAVVADIREVTKPVFALKGSALSEDEVEINIESSELFIASGTCIDISYIDND